MEMNYDEKVEYIATVKGPEPSTDFVCPDTSPVSLLVNQLASRLITNVIRRLESELGTKIYPGTEIMTDTGTHHFVKSSKNVLVPQPSNDPNDPLNWSPFWKGTTMGLTTIMSFAQAVGPLALPPMFPKLMAEFNCDLAGAVQFIGVCILVLGFSNFFWVPIMTTFGRRPVLIFSTLICVIANIWRGVATSYGSFMGACVLNGFGAGPAETAQPQIIADVMFLHERGAYNTLYFTAYFGSLMVGPIIAGPMTDYLHWRHFWWLNVGLLGAVNVALVFLFPETKWHRLHPEELANLDGPLNCGGVMNKQPEKAETTSVEAASELQAENGQVSRVETQKDTFLGKGVPCKRQFKLWQLHDHPFKSMLGEFWTPWKLHAFPIVQLAAFVVSWSASVFLTVNLTQSQNFAAPPYNFSPQAVGFTNWALLVGALIGLFTNGPLSDWVSMRATRKNNGIREPEMRLPAMIPYVILVIVCNLVVALGYQYKWDWRAIVLVGYTGAGIQVAALPAIISTYAIDSYKPVAGSIFVTITVNKNLWGYGVGKFLTPWTMKNGFIPAIMVNMALTVFWCACAIPFYVWGKKLRKLTSKSSVHKM
ncbi:hypothetical protein LOZ61_004745 [Ophidiomyces ophidiicola]|uniref:Uncharacterized protein n=1 Tax=Ophidiomyces ophidiicola TaxID=1387563 RepID=A0ACB8UWC7_9EURO|nr:hypothetical protein LOZ61_004745 [Ophidiomyces ophidiicola]KAI1924062.1 hypothetical protein LOZ64_000804 [Ophidiomyces ophidiicola]KAI1925062.1 hypothetical protein LOZ60_004341 [Ophidiomyces ophidiicola]KAI2002372.1 hypothetical protein LOZ49_006335 [Ophidiomyces ophidiicola]KAI2016005.1 hypothetical protein LOZ46_005105 [Ophidiomyces ophidiicola]